jgi:NADH-quinone oxidoreductase subunit K
MHLAYPLVVSALLFSIGLYGVLARRNAILVLMSVELMLNAVNLNLIAFDMRFREVLHSGQVFALFVIALAAAETGLGLAIVLLVHRTRGTVDVDTLRSQGERQFDASLDDAAPPAVPPASADARA